MSTIIRVRALDCPRETLVKLLNLIRKGRGNPTKLTQVVNGYYTAEIDDAEVAMSFMVALTAMSVDHTEVTDGSVQLKVSTPSGAQATRTNVRGIRQTGNPEVDAAINEFVATYYQKLTKDLKRTPTGVFGRHF